MENNNRMVQYGVWPDCTNNCDFCLRLNRKPYTKQEKIKWLDLINSNINTIDWIHDFAYGVSLLGGELYYIKDKDIQQHFLSLIDNIIDRVLVNGAPTTKFSTVTNGIYKPDFLYAVIDRIVDAVGIKRVDVNFSYDLKYRYKTDRARNLAIANINDFHKRYNYTVGVQMILTQHVINLWKSRQFNTNEFMSKMFPGCQLAFLYPHKSNTGRHLDDFYFNRHDFLEYVTALRDEDYQTYLNFINSCKNSGTFKYTGLRDRISNYDSNDLKHQIPILSDGKEQLMACGHSINYRCYADSDKCILCDLKMIDPDL